MSGRKKSEVVDLLAKGSEIRQEVLKNVLREFHSDAEYYNRTVNEIQESINEIRSKNFKLSDTLKKEFPEEAKKLESEFENLKVQATLTIKKESAASLSNEINNAQNDMFAADAEAEKITAVIRIKVHGCDDEYARAQKVIKTYSGCKERINSTGNLMKKHVYDSSIRKHEIESIKKKQQEFLKKQQELEDRANARSMRDQMKKEFNSINKPYALKFCNQEYSDLSNTIHQLDNMQDNEINNKSTKIFKEISDVDGKIKDAHREFEMKRAQVNERRDTIIKRLENFKQNDIKSLIKNNKVPIGLFEFEEKYGYKHSREKFEKLDKDIRESLAKENFDNCFLNLNELDELLNKSAEECQELYEKRQKELYFATKLFNALDKLGYPELEFDFIDNDIRNGYFVIAKNGDEELAFEKIAYDDDGNPIGELNHQESVRGTCHVPLKKVLETIQDEGVPMIDFKKENGKSIFGKTTSVGWGGNIKTPTPMTSQGPVDKKGKK